MWATLLPFVFVIGASTGVSPRDRSRRNGRSRRVHRLARRRLLGDIRRSARGDAHDGAVFTVLIGAVLFDIS
jgi:hypothetical protein